jgi:predicted site-specific integrase-resolvase
VWQRKTLLVRKGIVPKTTLSVYTHLMNIALYARVSTRDKGQDHENQLRELRAFVERKASEDWTLAIEYVDKASAKTADRPAFRKMLDAASRKEFDMVLFWSLDRFSREGVLETLQHLKALTSHGVEWFSYRELVPAVHRPIQRCCAGDPRRHRQTGAR